MKYLVALLISINIVLGAWWVIHGNIYFHTDIARDFLLIEDIVDKHNITLIGPRSGAIPGVFHGPLWIYLNVPAFVIGNGNPVIVGWFWVLLSVVNLLIIYQVGKKMFGYEVGLLSALLLSATQILSVKNMFNPVGALMLAPVFFYYFWKYLHNQKIRDLLFCLFSLGLIIQFQMAFGVPILILATTYILIFILQKKLFYHLLSFLILLIPLSTFIIFDLRHNFLQIHSVLNYLFGTETHGKVDLTVLQLTQLRLQETFFDGLGMVVTSFVPAVLLFVATFFYVCYKQFKNKKLNFRSPYIIFAYFYFGFWIISFLFKGPIWSYYFWPFLPLIILIIASFYQYINKILFFFLFGTILIINMFYGIKDVREYQYDPLLQNESFWSFNYQMARTVFADASSVFGYYVFTPDLYGYYPRYAMNFVQKENLNKKAIPFQKQKVTYLLIAPPPYYGQDPNSEWYKKNTNSEKWKDGDLKINRKPDKVWEFQNGFKIEKYILSNKEINIPSNPYLIQDLTFR